MTHPLSPVKINQPFLLRAIVLFLVIAVFLVPSVLAAPRIIVISLDGGSSHIVEARILGVKPDKTVDGDVIEGAIKGKGRKW